MPEPRHIVDVKQYCLPGGHDEIRAMIQELEKTQIVCSTHSQYTVPVWPEKKADGSWQITGLSGIEYSDSPSE